jgi:F-type H+-transporting ATPase subunit gamma
MSDTTASLRRKIRSAGDLQSVVRTMKALAASSIGQYEKSVRALGDYYRTVELGLGACFRESEPAAVKVERKGQTDAGAIGAVVFGSDQGLVGQFNDVVADYAIKTLAALPGKPQVWAVGERVHARLADRGLPLMGLFTVPNSVMAITPLVGQILVETEPRHRLRDRQHSNDAAVVDRDGMVFQHAGAGSHRDQPARFDHGFHGLHIPLSCALSMPGSEAPRRRLPRRC